MVRYWFMPIVLALIGFNVAVYSEHDDVEKYAVKGRVMYPPELGYMDSSKPQVKVLVDGGKMQQLTRTDGSFELHNLPIGSYRIDLFHVDMVFPSYLLHVLKDERVRLGYHNSAEGKGEQTQRITKPLVFAPKGKPIYFRPRYVVVRSLLIAH